MNKQWTKPLAAAVGAAVVGTLSVLPVASADQNPFSLTELSSGYMTAAEGACGGGDKADKEGKCGENKGDKGDKEGKCGEDKDKGEGSCGGK